MTTFIYQPVGLDLLRTPGRRPENRRNLDGAHEAERVATCGGLRRPFRAAAGRS